MRGAEQDASPATKTPYNGGGGEIPIPHDGSDGEPETKHRVGLNAPSGNQSNGMVLGVSTSAMGGLGYNAPSATHHFTYRHQKLAPHS